MAAAAQSLCLLLEVGTAGGWSGRPDQGRAQLGSESPPLLLAGMILR